MENGEQSQVVVVLCHVAADSISPASDSQPRFATHLDGAWQATAFNYRPTLLTPYPDDKVPQRTLHEFVIGSLSIPPTSPRLRSGRKSPQLGVTVGHRAHSEEFSQACQTSPSGLIQTARSPPISPIQVAKHLGMTMFEVYVGMRFRRFPGESSIGAAVAKVEVSLHRPSVKWVMTDLTTQQTPPIP